MIWLLQAALLIATAFFCLMAAIFSSRGARSAVNLAALEEKFHSHNNRLSMLEIDVNEKFSSIIAKISGKQGGRPSTKNPPEELNKKVGGIILHGPPIRDIIEAKRDS